jgi:hypothetical protein
MGIAIRLLMHAKPTQNDAEAVGLLTLYLDRDAFSFEGIIPDRGEAMPKLWVTDVCYAGIEAIRAYFARNF